MPSPLDRSAVAMRFCSNCIYHQGESSPVDGRRQCRANAPSQGIESHKHGANGVPALLATWPLTLPTDGCGQHRARFADPITAVIPATAEQVAEGVTLAERKPPRSKKTNP